MAKPVLVVTSRYMDSIEARIDQDYEARRNPHDRPFTCYELLEASSGAEALFVTPVDQLDSEFFKRLPASVKVIATYSVGLDHIDLQAAANRNVAIAYTPDNADATAEIAMLLMLGAARRAYEGQEIIRTGAWKPSSPTLLGWQLAGKILGIFGMGRVGRAVAQRARGFGMTIHYSNQTRLPAALEKDAVFHASPSDLLRVSQFLTLHAPETPETHHFINSKTIDFRMNDGTVYRNALRTPCQGAPFSGFSYVVRGGQICDNLQFIRVLRTHEICMLGAFTKLPRPTSPVIHPSASNSS